MVKYPLLIAISIILTACMAPASRTMPATIIPSLTESVQATRLPTSSPVSQGVLPLGRKNNWLKGVPCRAPCWEGITPGQTSGQQAMEILQRNPFIKDVELRSGPFYGDKGVLVWNWINGTPGGDLSYHLGTPDQLVYQIRPEISLVQLGEVIDAYGEPSHIVAAAEHGVDIGSGTVYQLDFIWLSNGFAMRHSNSGPDLHTKPSFDSEMILWQVTFFIPTLDAASHVIPTGQNRVRLSKWEGFKSFDYYCKDDSYGEVCRGQ